MLSPSVDWFGKITYEYKGNRKYMPATSELVGREIRLLTDLNISESACSKSSDGRKFKQLKTRVYALHDLSDKKLIGHASRLVISNGSVCVNEKMRQKVVKERSKTPHAYLQGTLAEILDNDNYERHFSLIQLMRGEGAVYISYDPYKTETFCVTGDKKHLGNDQFEIDELPRVETLKNLLLPQVYCFEDGILAMPSAIMNAKGLGQIDMFSETYVAVTS